MTADKRHLLRLILVISLWCQFLGFGLDAKAKASIIEESSREEQVSSYDGRIRCMAEEPQDFFVFSPRTPFSRFGNSRPSRLLSTNTGRSGFQSGCCSFSSSFNHLKFFCHHFCLAYKQKVSAASQRLYYVIALRRLLC